MFVRFFCRSILIRHIPQIERVCSYNLFNSLRLTFIMPPKRKAATKVVSIPDESEIPEEIRIQKGRKAKEVAEVKATKKDDASPDESEIPIKKGRKAKEAAEIKVTKKDNESPDESEIPIKKGRKAKEVAEVKVTKKDDESPDESEIPIKKGRKAKEVAEVKVTKKDDESQDESEILIKKGRKAKEAAELKVTKKDDESPDESEIPIKKGQKAKEASEVKVTKKDAEPSKSKAKTSKTKEKATKEPKKSEAKPLLNATETKWEEIDFGCEKKNAKGQAFNLKITSWNVDGLRAWLKKGGLDILKFDNPDILCLQETKCSQEKLPEEVKDIDGYHEYWCASDKEGYAGVAIYTKNKPISVKKGIDVEDHDAKGRCLTLEFKDFYIVNVYVPNAGRGLVTLPKRLEWNNSFKAFIKKLDKKKPVILCGDMNVAHNEIDLKNPKTNKKNAGFTLEERDGMTDFLADGYVDSFRELYPEDEDVYTFWSYMSKARPKNIGWRLDYFILSKRIMDNVCDNVVLKDVFGSDHCPITLFIHF